VIRLATGAVLAVALSGWPASTFAWQQGAPPPSPPVAGQPPVSTAPEHRHPAADPPPGPAGGEPAAKPQRPAPAALPPFIPPPTEADRKAAFPDVHGHAVHDQAVNSYVLLDRLEGQAGRAGGSLALDSKGWIGTDTDRFWFRAEGQGDGDRAEKAQVHLLYGRAISRWWGLVGGVRQDLRPGPAQTWAAVGIQGLAPYLFEVEATAYVGAGGRTEFRARTEYDLLLTNRLILQPLIEVELSGKSDPTRRVGAGLASVDAGLRVRYEIRRELAPYIGLTWDDRFFGTADFAAAAGERAGGLRLAVGIRLWR
jgi:copper resistance protein B